MILILLALSSIFLVLCNTRLFSESLRYNFIITLQVFGLFSFLSVEVFSYFNIITPTAFRLFWFVVIMSFILFSRDISPLKKIRNIILENFKNEKLLVGGIILIFSLTFLVGLLYAPITYDSLSYHLPRIEFWIQHYNLDYYATQTDRNLYQPPLAEYMVLQFRIIDNADYFDFFVQWIFGIGSCVTVSLITSFISKNKRTQILALFVSATIPMLILQSGTTQNDLIHAFFVSTVFLHFLRDFRGTKKITIIWAGLAIGQAILTKGTAYIFLLPICIWWGIEKLIGVYEKRVYFSTLCLQVSILLGLFILNIFTYYFRNFKYIGSPLGVSKSLYYVYNNQTHTIADLTSVMSRNIGLHFALPGLNKISEISLLWFHENILNLPLNNPATSFTDFDLPLLASTEDTVSCFLHIILIFPSAIFVLKKGNRMSKILLAIVTFCFFTFCYVVKFQIWHIRLHLPILLLASPLIALYINQIKLGKIVIILLLVSGVSYSIFAFGRPLLKFPPLTSEVYFTHPRNTHPYTFETEYSKKINGVIQFLEASRYKNIGIMTDDPFGNDPLYPIMYELRGQKKFISVQVSNESKKYQRVQPQVDCIIYFTINPPKDILTLNKHDKYFRIPNNAGNLIIFVSNNLKANK